MIGDVSLHAYIQARLAVKASQPRIYYEAQRYAIIRINTKKNSFFNINKVINASIGSGKGKNGVGNAWFFVAVINDMLAGGKMKTAGDDDKKGARSVRK